MSRAMRIYYFAILGAIGGLLAWQASNYLGLSFFGNLYIKRAGSWSADRFPDRRVHRTFGWIDDQATIIRCGSPGLPAALLGMAGGAIGLPVAEAVFQLTGGMLFSRMIGWGIFGLAIGFAGGIKGGSQAWKSALGGLLGGALGVLFLEVFRTLG